MLESDLRTEVENQTEELELEKASLRAVLDGMIDPAYICDSHYQLTFTNQAMKDLVGKSGEKTCYRAIYQRENRCDNCPLSQVLKGRVVRDENRSMTKAGRSKLSTPLTLFRKIRLTSLVSAAILPKGLKCVGVCSRPIENWMPLCRRCRMICVRR